MITSKPNECPAFHPYLVTYCSRYPCRMRKTRVQVCVSLAILVRVVAAFHWEIFVAQPLTPSWETPKYLTFFQYFIETCLHNVGVSCQREALTRVLTSFKSNFGDIVGGYFHSNFYQQVYYLKKKKKSSEKCCLENTCYLEYIHFTGPAFPSFAKKWLYQFQSLPVWSKLTVKGIAWLDMCIIFFLQSYFSRGQLWSRKAERQVE